MLLNGIYFVFDVLNVYCNLKTETFPNFLGTKHRWAQRKQKKSDRKEGGRQRYRKKSDNTREREDGKMVEMWRWTEQMWEKEKRLNMQHDDELWFGLKSLENNRSAKG